MSFINNFLKEFGDRIIWDHNWRGKEKKEEGEGGKGVSN